MVIDADDLRTWTQKRRNQQPSTSHSEE